MKKLIFCLILFLIGTSFLSGANDTLYKFLKTPFDLQKFKQKKVGANSHGADYKKYYLKPKVKGMYYSFFLFERLKGYQFNPDGKSQREVVKHNDLGIVTYKPKGKYYYDYLDPTEILIELVTRYNDIDLPELAFIGLSVKTIKDKLGNSFINKSDHMIYYKDNYVLILQIKNGMVSWLRYIRLNFNLKPNNIPSGILMDKN